MAASEVVLLLPSREFHHLPEPATDLKYISCISARISPSPNSTNVSNLRAWESTSPPAVHVKSSNSIYSGEECTARCEEDIGISMKESSVGGTPPQNGRCRAISQSRLLDMYGAVGRASTGTQFIDVDLSENGKVSARGEENVIWGVDQTSSQIGEIKAFAALQPLEGVEMKNSKVWKSIVDYMKPPSPVLKSQPVEKLHLTTFPSQNLSGPGGTSELHPSFPYKKWGLPPPECTLTSLLPSKRPEHTDKMTLVLDLDETLVHSAFKPLKRPDYVIPVEIDGQITAVHVVKRPHVDQFLMAMAAHFEIIVFTASLARYADPLLDLLDKQGTVTHRLFRATCQLWGNNYVKDLRVLGRDLSRTIIIDNSPHSYAFHPENAVPVSSFIDDVSDQELLDLIPFLRSLSDAEDVRVWLDEPGFFLKM